MEKFNSNNGFGKYKQLAILLLKIITSILDKYSINYCIISGTLLGYIRHNDFIPWDDDIDIIVDSSILDKIYNIAVENAELLSIFSTGNYLLKACFKNGLSLNKQFNMKYVYQNNTYKFPFIDMFIYKNENDFISFFKKTWKISEFFPPNKVQFLGMDISIPKNPDYFLTLNYGNDYMNIYKSNNYNHKKDIHNKIITIYNKHTKQISCLKK